MADRVEVELMVDVAACRVFGTKKFPARRQVVKKRAHLDLCSRGLTSVAHNFELAAIDNNFGSCERVSLARSQAKSRHAGNARQGFAPKSQRGDCLKIRSRPYLTGRVSLQRKQRIIPVHSTAVVDYANQRNSAAPNYDVDFVGTGVEAVFNQFFHH